MSRKDTKKKKKMDRPENCFRMLLEESTNYSPWVHTLKYVRKKKQKNKSGC
jgi:hypothetical protein